MAYYTEAGIMSLLGMSAWGSPTFFSQTRAQNAGSEADRWVDRQNDDAASTDKTNAANHYAVYLLLHEYVGAVTLGLINPGLDGNPGTQPYLQSARWHYERALEILLGDDAVFKSVFDVQVPDSDGTW